MNVSHGNDVQFQIPRIFYSEYEGDHVDHPV